MTSSEEEMNWNAPGTHSTEKGEHSACQRTEGTALFRSVCWDLHQIRAVSAIWMRRLSIEGRVEWSTEWKVEDQEAIEMWSIRTGSYRPLLYIAYSRFSDRTLSVYALKSSLWYTDVRVRIRRLCVMQCTGVDHNIRIKINPTFCYFSPTKWRTESPFILIRQNVITPRHVDSLEVLIMYKHRLSARSRHTQHTRQMGPKFSFET